MISLPRPKKSFGQHFLHDRQVIHKIIRALNPSANDFVVEIGPGRGALTFPLLSELHELYVIELDRELIPSLAAQGGHKLHIIQEDVLKVDFKALALQNPDKKLRIIGNLPYNISTPILFHLLQYKDYIHDMVFMLQKEVVERICAAPGSKTYGRLSVMIQVVAEATPLFTIFPGAFTPPPQVDSMLVRLQPYQNPRFTITNPEFFAEIVSQAFQMRRKTLRNALKKFTQLQLPETLANKRAEQLHVIDFAEISSLIK